MRQGRAARERSLARQYEWASHRIPQILLLLFSAVFVTVVSGYLLPMRVREFVIGAGCASAVWLVLWFIQSGSGTTPTMMGAEASEWTAGDLRPLREDGWKLLDGLDAMGWDADHVLYGEGGVYAIETRWMTWPSIEDGKTTSYVQGHVEQVRRGASHLRERLSKALYPDSPDVQPVLVVWGPGADELHEQQMWLGVQIVPGSRLKEWREGLGTGRLEEKDVDRVHGALLKEAEEIEAKRPDVREMVEAGSTGLAADLLLGIAGAFVAMLITTSLWSEWPYWQVALGAGPIVMGVGVLARRSNRWRAAATGWTVGAAGVALFLGAAVWLAANR